MKEYVFLVDAGVFVYRIHAENEDDARETLEQDGGIDVTYDEHIYPQHKDYLNAELYEGEQK